VNRAKPVLFLLLAAFTAPATSQLRATTLTFNYTSFDYPSAVNTEAYGISGNNIVGQYQDSTGNQYGFLYNGSIFTKIADPLAKLGGSFGTSAQGISGNNIVGSYPDQSGSEDGFIYNISTSIYTTIDDPLGTYTQAFGIDGNNIVGVYLDSGGNHGFLYDGSTYTTLNDPLGVYGTLAQGISGNNIVGVYEDSAEKNHGFVYNIVTQTYTTLNDPLQTNGTYAYGISGNNIVGIYDSGGYHGFLFNGTTYTTLDYPGVSHGTIVNGISGNNIVGFYPGPVGGDPLHGEGFLLVVPEPSSIALLVLGAIGFAVVARRKMRKQTA
jgi:hypothetical protein